MLIKRILRIVLITLVGIIGVLILFLLFAIGPIDRTPAREFDSYSLMMARLDKLDSIRIPEPKHQFTVGYARVSITPAQRTALAGYGNRKGKRFISVHDSVFVRAMVIDNGAEKVAIVSADLLIIPPTVTEQLDRKLAAIGFSLSNTYLGATHSHNSIGNWGKGATRFLYGSYQDSVVNFIADQIVLSIDNAAKNLLPSVIKSGEIPVPQGVQNRLIKDGPEDPLLRAIEVHRSDSSKLVFLSYTAHATCLFSKDLELSRDYPGKLVDDLESKGYAFAMFMAGAVGSHKGGSPQDGWSCIDWMAHEISDSFLKNRSMLSQVQDSSLLMVRVPLALSDPQVKLNEHLKARAWLFRSAFGEYPVSLTALRIGELVMMGAPCDFSGEFDSDLDSLAQAHHVKMMVTSFNGGYIGYVTPQKYYDVNHYETQLMNWYAPGTGEYIETCLEKLLVQLSK